MNDYVITWTDITDDGPARDHWEVHTRKSATRRYKELRKQIGAGAPVIDVTLSVMLRRAN